MYLHNMLDVCWKLCFKWNAWLLYKMCIFSINTCTCIADIIMRISEWISAFLLLLNLLSSLNFIYVASTGTCSSASNNIMLKCWKMWLSAGTCNLSLFLSVSLTWPIIGLSSVFYDMYGIKIIKYPFLVKLKVSLFGLIIVHVLDCCHKLFSIRYI